MMTKPCYTMTQLCEMTGVSKHQVYRWRTMRLLSPAHHQRNIPDEPLWGQEHVDQIRAILAIRDNNRTLADIKDMLHPENDE
jgi:DNA-binding transcriptional MerR regulator